LEFPRFLRGCVRGQTQVGTEWFLAGLPEEEEDAERRALLVELEAASMREVEELTADDPDSGLC
jgi:hypothetical protein